MRRWISVVAVLLLLWTATVSVAAESLTGKDEGSYTIGVGSTYKAAIGGEAVISVDIAWDTMSFEYDPGTVGTWDPVTHSYSGSRAASWSDNKVGIAVANHSNAAVEANFTFTPNTGITTTGTFYAKNTDQSFRALTAAEQFVGLGSAQGTGAQTPPTKTMYFGVSGDGVTTATTLGTVTVSVTQSSKIYDAYALRAAVASCAAGGTIQLAGDVDMTTLDTPVLNLLQRGLAENPLVLDLNGHTLKGSILSLGSYVVIKNGTIAFATADLGGVSSMDGGVVSGLDSHLSLENVTVNATGVPALASICTEAGTKTRVVDSTFNGGYVMGTSTIAVVASGSLDLAGRVTTSDLIAYASDTLRVTLQAGGTYSLNETVVSVDADTTYTPADACSWMVRMN